MSLPSRTEPTRPSRSGWRTLLLSGAVPLLAACADAGDTPTAPEEDGETAPSSGHLASPPSSGEDEAAPDRVSDLVVAGVTPSTVTLRWSAVDDGTGAGARYEVRLAPTGSGFSWDTAPAVREGYCAPGRISGAPGTELSCTVTGLERFTSYDLQLVSFRESEGEGRVDAETRSDLVTAMTSADPPQAVSDLAITGVTSDAVTLAWTDVDDGSGSAALYEVRYAAGASAYSWRSANKVVDGLCGDPVVGRTVGSGRSCTLSDLEHYTPYSFQVASYRVQADGTRVYADTRSKVVGEETLAALPGDVTDLRVSGYTSNSVTLDWTAVGDGTWNPAHYEVRTAASPMGDDATIVSAGDCASPVDGIAVGALLSCTVDGLPSGASHDFQLLAFRDDGSTRVYSAERSNVVTGVTDDAPVPGDDTESSDTGPGSGTYPWEPAGFSPLAETSYAEAREGGFSSSLNEDFSIVSDAGAPRSPSTVAQARFRAGLGDGTSPIWSETSISGHGVEQVYVSFWLKVSANWQGHGTGVNKTAIVWTHEKPVVVANILGSGSGRLSSEIRIQDVPDGADNLGPTLADPEIVRGRWHQWEIVLVSNTGDMADGEIHWWIDGQKVGEYRNVRFGTSSQSKIWNYAAWRPVWGGRGDTVQEDMYMWMDHYYVSGAP